MNYGPVVIIKGQHVGKIGLYADEECGRPIVYLFRKRSYVYLKDESFMVAVVGETGDDFHSWVFVNTMGFSIGVSPTDDAPGVHERGALK